MIQWFCAHKSSKKSSVAIQYRDRRCRTVYVQLKPQHQLRAHTHLTKGHPTFPTYHFSVYFHPCSTPLRDRFFICPLYECILFLWNHVLLFIRFMWTERECSLAKMQIEARKLLSKRYQHFDFTGNAGFSLQPIYCCSI